ncbi:MAG: hypothetical protein KDB53_20475 [Planctomycetes bacterium]|nr:hypothetical protein [Planctomycetota bacterium]
MRFLINAGPTREMIDEVRFLSNLSSGRTGYAVALAARDLGHTVTLVTGPVGMSPPRGINVRRVVSALEMQAAMLDGFSDADVVVATAAVSDYRPAQRVEGKLKKSEGGLTLELVRNPDILAEMGRRKDRQVLVGFALEVQDAEQQAQSKFERKGLDLLVLNGPGNFGSARSSFRLLTRNGFEAPREASKEDLGRLLVERASELARTRGASPGE